MISCDTAVGGREMLHFLFPPGRRADVPDEFLEILRKGEKREKYLVK